MENIAMRETAERIRNSGSSTPSDERRGATSVAAIGKHPIHPMLIPFPVAFLTAALGTDVAYARTRDPFWARSSMWLLRLGLVSGAVAATAGAVDYVSIPRARKHAIGPLHAVGNATVLALSLGNLASRWKDPEEAVMPRGLAMSAATAALLGVTAWAGAELVYRHRVAVVEEEDAVADDLIGQH
ncbi:DUF2231 domain-containing protein [Skermanella rosea]|uniref:DUF2231 domain-containing protein n=1 Tax=Skermanella rosea TaxID=1817965 RepID=UPI0019315A2E|nr:DUF2231 domain-containing protein [Skermanella rosea]UEM03439.1 DUF2231 domain-containing protein [Skermanella rosea]